MDDKVNGGFGLPGSIWRVVLAAALAWLLFGTGCVSKARARAEAQAAFAAGQQEAFSRMTQMRGPTITVVGPVRVPFVPWTEELTLARAIIESGYLGTRDPQRITLIRGGEEQVIEPEKLLAGEDLPLEAGDIIRIE